MATAKRLPSGNWRVNVYIGKDVSGKRKYKSFTDPDKRKAERAAAEYADAHREVGRAETFRSAAESYIEKKSKSLSPTTISEYRKILKNYCGNIEYLPLDDITDNVLQSLVDKLSESLAPKTVRNIYGFITAVIYLKDPNRRFSVELPKKVKHFKELPSPEEVFAAVKGTEIELPALLAMWLSLRMSEIRGLRKSDLKNGVLTVQNAMVTVDNKDVLKSTMKTYDSTRRLSVPSYIAALINNVDTEFLVEMSRIQIYKSFQRALEKAGLPHMPFHDLRHINASVMLKLGIPDKYAMERGGWASTNILKSVYQNTFSNERVEVDKRIDDYFNSFVKE